MATSNGPGYCKPARRLCLFHELRFQIHRPDPVDLAVDIVIALDQPDVLDLGADLHHRRGTFNLEILDDGDGIAASPFRTVGRFGSGNPRTGTSRCACCRRKTDDS